MEGHFPRAETLRQGIQEGAGEIKALSSVSSLLNLAPMDQTQ